MTENTLKTPDVCFHQAYSSELLLTAAFRGSGGSHFSTACASILAGRHSLFLSITLQRGTVGPVTHIH